MTLNLSSPYTRVQGTILWTSCYSLWVNGIRLADIKQEYLAQDSTNGLTDGELFSEPSFTEIESYSLLRINC